MKDNPLNIVLSINFYLLMAIKIDHLNNYHQIIEFITFIQFFYLVQIIILFILFHYINLHAFMVLILYFKQLSICIFNIILLIMQMDLHYVF